MKNIYCRFQLIAEISRYTEKDVGLNHDFDLSMIPPLFDMYIQPGKKKVIYWSLI